MRRAVASVALLLAVAGCRRDLELPPKPSVEPLGVLPAFKAVAPQQGWTFVAAGGVGPYTFAFAQGGRLSGPGADVDPSGVYTAGSSGSAQDVIEVTDSRGVKAAATVSVGQRIAITPPFTGTVPGGRVTFQATGGDAASHAFALGTAGSGGDVTPGGVYTAGSTGDTVDTVLAGDVFGASARAEIRVGPAVTLYRSETRPVAPHETVTFIALGGQPPYAFSMDVKGSGSDARIDPASGVYVAGTRAGDLDPSAVTTDVVRVTDSAFAPQSATLVVQVGARLRLELTSAEVFPGLPVQLVASGGKPPYGFGFAARVRAVPGDPSTDPDRAFGGNGGNRSHGSVNPFSGEYVPGFSPGAVDYLQVVDATGGPAAVLRAPPIGGVPMSIGTGVETCYVGDLNGDRSEDVIFAVRADGTGKFIAAELLDTVSPFVQSYFTPADPSANALAVGLAGTGRERILLVGGEQQCTGQGQWCPGRDLWALTPDFAGYLTQEQVFGGDPQQVVTVLNPPASQNGSGTAYHQVTANYGIRTGTGFWDAARSTLRLFTDGQISDTVPSPFFSPGPSLCQDPSGFSQTDAWLTRLDWPAGAAAPTPICLRVKGFCPMCSATVHRGLLTMAVGDFDGDGKTDLAWVLQDEGQFQASSAGGAKLYVASATAVDPAGLATIYTAASVKSGWPSGSWTLELRNRRTDTRLLTVRPPPGSPPGTPDALLVRLREDATGRGKLFLVRDPTQWIGPLDPAPAGPGVDGVGAYVPAPGAPSSYVAWSGNDGVVSGFGVVFQPALGFGPAATVATFPFAVNAVCAPDVNGDGAPDLVAASDVGAAAQLVLGDGTVGASTGTFGAQVHQRGGTFPLGVGDLDGDGFGDAAVASAGAGMSVMWGGGGMLAWGDQISAAPIATLAVADWTGAGGPPSILFQEKSGRFGLLRNRGDGTFDPAAAVSGFAATGGAAGTGFYAFPARLGTSHPGPDAFSFRNNGWMAALLVQAGRVVELPLRTPPALDAVHLRPKDCWPSAVGGDAPAVVLACAYENRSLDGQADLVALLGATIQGPDAPPGPGGPSFTDWVLLTSTTATPQNPFTRPPPAGTRMRLAAAGPQDTRPAWQQPRVADTAVFLVQTDVLHAVEVRTNGAPGSPASWTVETRPVTPASVGQPFIASAGSLEASSPTANADYAFTVAAGGDTGLDLFRRSASGWYELVHRRSRGGFPLGIAPLSTLAPGVRSPGDVVTFIGDFSNTGLTPEIVPLLNDGNGALR